MTRRKPRRKWWGRRPFKAKRYVNATEVHEFENEVILRKIRTLTPTPGGGGPVWAFSAGELIETNPDLFDPRYLPRTLKRMKKDKILSGGGRVWGTIYVLDEREAKEAKAA